MKIWTYAFYLIGCSLQGLLIWRAFRCAAWRFYAFFYTYFLYTCIASVIQFLLASIQYPQYANVYWGTEAGAAVLRFALAWEIFRQAFPHRSLLRGIAGSVLVTVLALLALGFWASGPSPGTSFIIDFMRKMALAEAVWIVIVLGLVNLYRVPIGRNIWGIAIGFLIFAASQLANFAGFDLSPRFKPIWQFVHPFSYLCMLAIWVWSLWNYAPNPSVQGMEAEASAQALSYWRDRFAVMNGLVRKVVKPWSNLS